MKWIYNGIVLLLVIGIGYYVFAADGGGGNLGGNVPTIVLAVGALIFSSVFTSSGSGLRHIVVFIAAILLLLSLYPVVSAAATWVSLPYPGLWGVGAIAAVCLGILYPGRIIILLAIAFLVVAVVVAMNFGAITKSLVKGNLPSIPGFTDSDNAGQTGQAKGGLSKMKDEFTGWLERKGWKTPKPNQPAASGTTTPASPPAASAVFASSEIPFYACEEKKNGWECQGYPKKYPRIPGKYIEMVPVGPEVKTTGGIILRQVMLPNPEDGSKVVNPFGPVFVEKDLTGTEKPVANMIQKPWIKEEPPAENGDKGGNGEKPIPSKSGTADPVTAAPADGKGQKAESPPEKGKPTVLPIPAKPGESDYFLVRQGTWLFEEPSVKRRTYYNLYPVRGSACTAKEFHFRIFRGGQLMHGSRERNVPPLSPSEARPGNTFQRRDHHLLDIVWGDEIELDPAPSAECPVRMVPIETGTY